MSKNVQLKSLYLANFKGIKELTANFGEVTVISGANATGKTTIFDGFTWCLFGKDSGDRTDSGKGGFTIKTVDATGRVIDKLTHEVTAVIEVNGQAITLTRRLTEDWVKPRGKAEVELKGNTTSYYIDGVEVKASAYQESVASIIEEQLFKLITNPSYFPSLGWQTQREILLRIAGGVTYEEIAADRSDFAAIIAQLGGKDMVTFKQGIAYQKRAIQDDLDKCPVEISAIASVTPEEPDYTAIEATQATLTKELASVEAEINDVAEVARKRYEAAQEMQKAINDLRNKQQTVLFEAKQAAQKDGFEKNAKHREAEQLYEVTKREAASSAIAAENELSTMRRKIVATEATLTELKQRRAAKLAEWNKRNADEYHATAEGLICPIYKTLCSDASVLKLDVEAKAEAKMVFERAKEADLERITKEGKDINKQIAEAEELGKTLNDQLLTASQKATESKAAYDKQLADLEATIGANPEIAIVTDIDPNTIGEFATLEGQIKAISDGMVQVPISDTSALQDRKKQLNDELDEVKQKLNIRTTIETNRKRMADIEKREKELAQQLADLEKKEFVTDELNKARMDEVERRVNGKFRNVRFRMFETQLNGGEAPTCIATVDGVKFADLNNAKKINAGLDIINTLCLFHDVMAPVFIDNAESVNELFPVASQLIKLVVTTDNKLSITY